MNNIAIGAIAFVAGVGVGAIITHFSDKVAYSRRLSEEMKEFTARRIAFEKDRARIRGENLPDETPEPERETKSEAVSVYPKELEAIREYSAPTYEDDVADVVEEEDETEEEEYEPSPKMDDDDIRAAIQLIEEEGWSEKDVADDYGVTVVGLRLYIENFKKSRMVRGRKTPPVFDVPYTITLQKWEEERLEYEKVDLIFYRGDECILFDETGAQMLEIGLCLGKASNLYEDKQEGQYIYIRNDTYKKDYRILCREESSDE